MEEGYYARIGYTAKKVTNYYKELLTTNFIPNPAVLIRTKIARDINGYDESLLYEDWDMWLKMARRCEFICDTNITSYYRIRQNSMMMDPANKIKVNHTLIKVFQNNTGIAAYGDQLVWKKLQQYIIYSFF